MLFIFSLVTEDATENVLQLMKLMSDDNHNFCSKQETYSF
jgi:hypothetical protein